jgi:lactoylglutathione lyase
VDLSGNSVNVITVFAEDVPKTKSFYEEVFGLPVAFEDETATIFKFANIIINLAPVSAAPERIGPATLAPQGAGSRTVFAIFVDDVDAVCADLADRGVTLLNGPMDRPWGMRTAAFADPAGHIWAISQDLDA